ncbi:MAG: hypothetical protein WDN08_10245 [Rhizomicrobium sp.]
MGQHLRHRGAEKRPGLGYDLTKQLVDHGYDAVKIVHTADNWYQSIGCRPSRRRSGRAR